MNSAASPKKSFFGRERELSELTDSLMDPECRILTITGIGGIGKTTLALRLAEKMQGHFRNGFASSLWLIWSIQVRLLLLFCLNLDSE